MQTLHFNLMRSLAISRSCYEKTSRCLAQLNDKCSCSVRQLFWQLMKKHEDGLSCLKWRISMGHRWFSGSCDRYGQEDTECSRRGPNSRKGALRPGAQQPRRASSDHYIGSQTAMRPLTVARERWVAKSVPGSLANVLHLISIIHVFGHFMPFLAILCH